ncbi:hypothetical protein [Erythrobacter sp. MTPC3]|uniref:hypothetical protein n=1 Tax=Erythrobacter sp. MTPC3 TaxID=3056564 RepID=UPI0036F20FC3
MSIIRNARLARYATLGVLVLVLLAMGLSILFLFDEGRSAEAKIQHFAATLPSLFFVGGIWMTERAFKAIAVGQAVELALSNLLERLGICLFLGGMAFVFGRPLILKALLDSSAWGWFDVPAITLGCVGLLLFVLGRPLRVAAAARAELDEIL